MTALPGQEISPSFSPDGNQVAFAWDGETNGAGFDLYVKVIGTDKPLRLTNHPAPWLGVAWSPDGRTIAVHRVATEEGGIFLVPALGGPERKLASTNNSGAGCPHRNHFLVTRWKATRICRSVPFCRVAHSFFYSRWIRSNGSRSLPVVSMHVNLGSPPLGTHSSMFAFGTMGISL